MAECDPKDAIDPAHHAAILAHRPDLAGAPVRLHTDGWDCLAIEVNERWLFKIPLHEGARQRLRREPAALDLIRPATRIPVPAMRLLEGPVLMSEHEKLPGVIVDGARYATLGESERARLALDLAGFFADIHAIDPAAVAAADCDALRPWDAAPHYIARIEGHLPDATVAAAREAFARHARHGADALVFGQFDTHGWNMAYDLARGRLAGLFDFAGAGVGGLHRDLSYLLFVSPDLTERVLAIYGAATGRSVEASRVYDAHAALRAIELCEEGPAGDVPRFTAALLEFLALARGR